MLSVIFDNSFCAYRTYKPFKLCEKTKGSAFSKRYYFHNFTSDFYIYSNLNINTISCRFNIDSSVFRPQNDVMSFCLKSLLTSSLALLDSNLPKIRQNDEKDSVILNSICSVNLCLLLCYNPFENT